MTIQPETEEERAALALPAFLCRKTNPVAPQRGRARSILAPTKPTRDLNIKTVTPAQVKRRSARHDRDRAVEDAAITMVKFVPPGDEWTAVHLSKRLDIPMPIVKATLRRLLKRRKVVKASLKYWRFT